MAEISLTQITPVLVDSNGNALFDSQDSLLTEEPFLAQVQRVWVSDSAAAANRVEES